MAAVEPACRVVADHQGAAVECARGHGAEDGRAFRCFTGIALDFGAGGEVTDAVEDARGTVEVAGGGRGIIVCGQATGHPRGFGHHLQRRVGVGGHGGGHQPRALTGAANESKAFGGEQLHPFEQVSVGHALDSGNGVHGDGDAGVRLAGAIEPLHARKEVPEAVVGVTLVQLHGDGLNLTCQAVGKIQVCCSQGQLHLSVSHADFRRATPLYISKQLP